MTSRLCLLTAVLLAAACGRGGFGAVQDELAECWPACGGDDDAPPRPFPFSFDDVAFFAQVTDSAPRELACESVADQSITESGAGSAVVNLCEGGISTMTRVRIGGGSIGDGYRCRGTATMNIVDSWIESQGGDPIQCYDPNNVASAALNISGTTLSALPGTDSALFIADSYAVDVRLTNVLIRGGSFGLRFHTDGRPGTLALDDVCFYGESDSAHSFDFEPFLLDPNRPTIAAWNNVRWCTIEGEELVVHGLIPPP
ncbi:MAG: hypothetical protein ACAI38_21670 [Myxococcota bacterium]